MFVQADMLRVEGYEKANRHYFQDPVELTPWLSAFTFSTIKYFEI